MEHTVSRPLRRTVELVARELDTPRCLTVFLLVRAKEWDQIAKLRCDPTAYIDTISGAEKYRRDVLVTSLLRKLATLPSSIDKRQAALNTFFEAEEQCARTNVFLESIISLPLGAYEIACSDILKRAKKWISRTVGRVPDDLPGRFGPGTVFELKGSTYSTLADKFWSTTHVTPSAKPIFDFLWSGNLVDRTRMELGLPYSATARGNRFTTVPKDATTDRGICIEPAGNLFCQLGVGGYLKERLASVGIYIQREPDLDPLTALQVGCRPNGQTVHRSLARDGSISGEWATIDLSSASDTVAYSLVKGILPTEWFKLLNALRSPFTLLPGGRWFRLEKFSSMGNGFTFELETLIFCGLIHGVTGLLPGRDFFVYGDDIIVPSKNVEDTLAVLSAFGFTPNRSKTFTAGPFRESCGGDFFLGFDVRPLFVKDEPIGPTDWYVVFNELWRRGLTLPLRHILDQIPTRERWFGPAKLGHAVLWTDNQTLWRTRHRDGVHWVVGLVQRATIIPLERWGCEFILPLALCGVRSRGLSPAGQVSGYQRIRLSVS